MTAAKYQLAPMAAALIALYAFPASAQTDPSNSSGLFLEEVIVTAQKREESLQESPIAVSAFSAQMLQDAGITDTTELSATVPNMLVTNVAGVPGSAAVVIRGLGTVDPQLATDVKVGTYIDGVYMARLNNAAIELADIERVEVLRGPQGTLYGRNTTGGAMNIHSSKPSGEFGFTTRSTIGNRGYWRTFNKVDLPDTAGVSASLSYLATEHDGLVKNTAERPEAESMAGSDDTSGYRVALRWEPTDTVNVDFSHSSIDREGTPQAAQVSWNDPDGPGAAYLGAVASESRLGHVGIDFLELDKSETEMTTLLVEWDLGWATFKSITGYSEWERQGTGDQDGGELLLIPGNPDLRLVAFLGFNDSEQDQFSQEFQLVGTALDDRLDYIAGLFYFEESTKETSSSQLGLYDPAGGSGRTATTDNEATAIFGQVTWRPDILDERLSLTGGLRYGEDKKEAYQLLSELPDMPLNGDDDWNNISWLAVVDYAVNDDTSTYFKVSTGYNAGGFNIRDTSIVDAENGEIGFETPYDEEELLAYELGIKAELWDGRARVNSAIFYNDFTDMQTNFVFPQDQCLGSYFCGITENAGKAEMRGLEIEVSALLTEALRLDANYAYIDAEVKEFLLPDGTDDADNRLFSRTPEHSGAVSLVYDFPATDYGTVSARLDASHRSEIDFGSSTRNRKTYQGDDLTLINARLSLLDIPVPEGDLQISLWVKNLENKAYRSNGIDLGFFTNNIYGELRSYGLDLAYQY